MDNLLLANLSMEDYIQHLHLITTPQPLALHTLNSVQAMGIQRYMFFSIHNCEKHPEVPLMQMMTCTEKYLADSGLNYTIFRLCGFMQVRTSACAFALHC